MTRRFPRALSSLSLLLGFVAGCGSSAPEIKLDPAMANKPFPKAGGAQDWVPKIKSSIDRPAARSGSPSGARPFPKAGGRQGP